MPDHFYGSDIPDSRMKMETLVMELEKVLLSSILFKARFEIKSCFLFVHGLHDE